MYNIGATGHPGLVELDIAKNFDMKLIVLYRIFLPFK
jgi:hypothetical protein